MCVHVFEWTCLCIALKFNEFQRKTKTNNKLCAFVYQSNKSRLVGTWRKLGVNVFTRTMWPSSNFVVNQTNSKLSHTATNHFRDLLNRSDRQNIAKQNKNMLLYAYNNNNNRNYVCVCVWNKKEGETVPLGNEHNTKTKGSKFKGKSAVGRIKYGKKNQCKNDNW